MKLINFSLCAVAALMMCACDNGSETTNHTLAVTRPDGVAYADQTKDTLQVYSTDTWTATIADVDWLSPNEFSRTIGSNILDNASFPLTVKPNTTGKIRTATISVKANGKTLNKTYAQMPWLNIKRPTQEIRRSDGTVTSLYDYDHLSELMAYFYFQAEAKGAQDSITMTLYAPSAEITTGDDWVSLRNADNEYVKSMTVTLQSGEVSRNIVIPFVASASTLKSKRTGTITITTSNGLVQPVSIYQAAVEE